MKSGSSSKGTTKNHRNVEDNLESTFTKMYEHNQTQGGTTLDRLQEFAQEVMVEARTIVQDNHEELLDRKLTTTKTRAAVPVTTQRPRAQCSEVTKEEDWGALGNYRGRLEKKFQPMTMDGMMANGMSEDSTKMALIMTDNEPESATQKTKETPGAIAIMGTGSPLMRQGNQFSSAFDVNESTVPESAGITTLQQMEEQALHFATATLVVDEYGGSADPPVLASATKIDTEAIAQASRRRQVKTAVISFVLAIAAGGIAYAIYASTRPNTQPVAPTPNVISAPNETPTLNPSASPSMNLLTFIADQSFDNGAALDSPDSPQHKALVWIENNIDGALLNDNDYLLQLYSLTTLFYATLDRGSIQFRSSVESSSWMVGIYYCSWSGVTCKDDGSILISLDLNKRSLSGSIPVELGHLSDLVHLDLGDNALNGTLPSEIGFLTNLIDCQVYNNTLTGPLPSEIGLLTSLEHLSLGMNEFNDILPTEIGQLTSLKWLELPHSELSGTLPSEIGKLSSLTSLDLTFNKLSGTLPSEIGLLTILTEMLIGGNKLTGKVPMEIGKMTHLETFGLFQNQFNGTILTEIEHLSNLIFVFLNNNNFTGTIPLEIQLLTNLKHVALSSNQFKGTLPTEIGLLNKLTFLSLSSNQLSGHIPTEIGQLTLLTVLYLSDNQFSSAIPTEVGQLDYLREADFSLNTDLTGTVPVEVCNASALKKIRFCLPLACNCTSCKVSASCQ